MNQSLRDILSFRGENGLFKEDRGIGVVSVIAAIGGLLGLGLLSQSSAVQNISWPALVAVFTLIVVGIGVAGWTFGNLKGDQVLLVSTVALGIFVVFEIGVMAATGILTVGGVMYTINPWGKRLWIWMTFIGVGLTFVFLGEYLGVNPVIEEGLQAVSP